MQTVKAVSTYKVNLKELRKKAGLSLRKLGELSGVSFAYINKIENGLNMTEETWKKLKKVLKK